MKYLVTLSPDAIDDLAKLRRNEPKAYEKALDLIDELSEHPRIGKGKPEPLSGDRSGQWSRRINHRHRMVYEIQDTVVKVFVLSSYGHYDDK